MNDRASGEGSRRRTIRGCAWLAALAVVGWTGAAHAQLLGTGGTTGLASGPLGDSDFFIGVQKVMGVNLSDVDKARFLNHASCQCKRDVWLKAILNASSAAKAQLIAGTDTVTMVVGFQCDQPLYRASCLNLGSTSLSQFRLSGMLVHTTVDVLAKSYGATTTTIGTITGSGGDSGVTGTGGTTGSGGATGSGGTAGTEPTTATDPCAVGDAFSQTVYLFVESSPGMYDGSAQLSVVIDGSPPPAPSPVTVNPANEALTVDWTSVNTTSVPDLLGYQVFCTRADRYQVFKDGTFSTSVDTCNTGLADDDPNALTEINTHYLCSDFLSTSTSSHRVEILQNDIQYGIAVAAVDRHGNASVAFPSPPYTAPVPTLDFYHQYREGDPQGQATGGCSVGGGAAGGGVASALVATAAVAIAIGRRKRRRGRPS